MSQTTSDLLASQSVILQLVLFLATAALHRTAVKQEQIARERANNTNDKSESRATASDMRESTTSTIKSYSPNATEDLKLYAMKRMRGRLSFDATRMSMSKNLVPEEQHHHFENSYEEGTKCGFEKTYSELNLQKDQVDHSLNTSGRSLIDFENMEPKARRRSKVQKTLDHINYSFNSMSNSSSSSDAEGEYLGFDAASVYATETSLALSATSNSFNGSHGKFSNPPSRSHSLTQEEHIQHIVNGLPPARRSFQRARSTYNSRIMPNRVIMVRHGQSEGNINENVYTSKPDNLIQLTKLGWEQARMAGNALRNQILERKKSKVSCHGFDEQSPSQNGSKLESVHFIVSPYVRTMETFHGMLSAWCDPDEEFGHIKDIELRKMMWYDRLKGMGVSWHEDPRIREQDFGNYQDPNTIRKAKSERHKFGAFYYRFPNGEAASDVYERVSTFLDSLWRSFDVKRSDNYVIVTHGISIRVLLARYFRYSIDQFSMLANPRNAEMILLAHDGKGKLELEGRCELELKETEENADGNNIDVTGFRFYDKLRIVPKHYMRSRTIRLSDK